MTPARIFPGKPEFVKGLTPTGRAVAALRARGLAVCRPEPASKSPTYKGWPKQSLEPADFAEGDPVGILGGPLSDCRRPGHALVIIDVDDLLTLANADEFLPATGMAEGRPGKPRDHRYFLTPLDSIPEWAWSQAAQAAAAARQRKGHPGPFKKGFNHARTGKRLLDFIGTGGQCVCPYPGGRRSWEGGSPGEPTVVAFADLWESVCELARAHAGKPVAEAPPPTAFVPGSANVEANVIRRAIRYLAKCCPATSGARGHDVTFQVARVICWGFGLGESLGFQILWTHYNRRCQPPWSESELRHKVHEASTLPFDKPWCWLLGQSLPPRILRRRAGLVVSVSGWSGPAAGADA
jgi:hypothetical protein